MKQVLILHYHEIWLKGENKNYFLSRLRDAVRQSVADLPMASIEGISERLILTPAMTRPFPVLLSACAGFSASPTLPWRAKCRVRLKPWARRRAK